MCCMSMTCFRKKCLIPGTIPLSFHVDGAEFFRDAEYNVWSMSSILSGGDVPGKMFMMDVHATM
jgi:hypothetical protein